MACSACFVIYSAANHRSGVPLHTVGWALPHESLRESLTDLPTGQSGGGTFSSSFFPTDPGWCQIDKRARSITFRNEFEFSFSSSPFGSLGQQWTSSLPALTTNILTPWLISLALALVFETVSLCRQCGLHPYISPCCCLPVLGITGVRHSGRRAEQAGFFLLRRLRLCQRTSC